VTFRAVEAAHRVTPAAIATSPGGDLVVRWNAVERHPASTDRFVGRAHELGLVEAACAEAGRGRGSVTVVSGEAGIGKTRFCREVADRAERSGLVVVTARCWADGGAPPLWPWQAIVAELCGAEAAELLESDTGDVAVDRDRFARFAAVTDRLAEACARAPVCLVVDDVHAADAGALLLARFVARSLGRLPLALVLARRRGEPAVGPESGLLDEIESESGAIALHDFDPAEAALFLAGHGLDGLDAGVVAAVVRVTGGNPLFLRQVAALGPPGPGDDLPTGVRVAIDRALGRLRPEARRLLASGAVLGLAPSVREVAAVAESEPAAVLDAITEAAVEGLVTREIGEEALDRFAFTHELVRSAFEDGLGATDRLDAHARAASTVAPQGLAHGPVQGSDRLARRAHHALAAAARSGDDARIAVTACQAAAEGMAHSFAYEQADGLLSAAVALHERPGLGPPRAALLVDWAQAALRCGRMTEARERFDHAAAAAEREGDPVLLAEAALGLGGHWLNEHRAPVERARVLGMQRSALAGLSASSSEEALRSRLAARLAAEAVFDGGQLAPVQEALDAARRCGDSLALAESLSLCHHALFGPDHTRSRLPLADELVRVASEAGHGVLALMGLCWRAADLFHLGDPGALRVLEELRERASALACQNILYIVDVIDVMLLVRQGRLDDAEAAAHRCYEVGESVGEVDTLGYLSTHLLGIRWCQGRDTELLEVAGEVAESPTLIRTEFALRASTAAIAARAGQPERARGMLERLAPNGLAALPRSSTWAAGIAAVVEAAAELDDPALARQAYDLLAPFADLPVVASVAVMCLGSTERSLGVAASTFGDHDRAAGHLERAVAANRRLGNRPLVAIARADLAAALARRDRPGDGARAAELLEHAVGEATSMGMMPRAAAWQSELAAVRAQARVRHEDRAEDRIGVSNQGATAGPTGATAGPTGAIYQVGGRWVVALNGREAQVADLVGMSYLVELLTHPGQQISALTLVARGEVAPDQARQDLLDGDARAAYEARARELSDDLAEAEANNDIGLAERLRTELDALVDELTAATGLSRRSRAFTDNAERARTAVRKAIKRAIDAIDDTAPTVAELLRSTVTTGTTCVYRPDPRTLVTWSARPPATADDPEPTSTANPR
jgi:tetratricopeptide (TPR) repeat protein